MKLKVRKASIQRHRVEYLTPASALCVTQPTDRGTENMATLLL